MSNLHLGTKLAQTFLRFAGELRCLRRSEFVFVASVELEPSACLKGTQGICLSPGLADPAVTAALPAAMWQGMGQGKLPTGSSGTGKTFAGSNSLGVIRQ